MNKYIIILLIIIILFYLLHPINIEFFEADIYDSPNCCVIRKRRHYDTFKYFFNKSKNCDIYHDNK